MSERVELILVPWLNKICHESHVLLPTLVVRSSLAASGFNSHRGISSLFKHHWPRSSHSPSSADSRPRSISTYTCLPDNDEYRRRGLSNARCWPRIEKNTSLLVPLYHICKGKMARKGAIGSCIDRVSRSIYGILCSLIPVFKVFFTNLLSEVCARIRCYYHKWPSSKPRPYHTKWRSYGVRSLLTFPCNPSHPLSRNVVHRHEPPVSATPVRILLEDKEREFIVVDKPGSIVRSSIPVSTFDLS